MKFYVKVFILFVCVFPLLSSCIINNKNDEQNSKSEKVFIPEADEEIESVVDEASIDEAKDTFIKSNLDLMQGNNDDYYKSLLHVHNNSDQYEIDFSVHGIIESSIVKLDYSRIATNHYIDMYKESTIVIGGVVYNCIDYFQNNFVVLYVEEDRKVDHTKTFLDEGKLTYYQFMVRDIENNKWYRWTKSKIILESEEELRSE